MEKQKYDDAQTAPEMKSNAIVEIVLNLVYVY